MNTQNRGYDAPSDVSPDGPPLNLAAAWASAATFDEFVADAKSNEVFWRDMHRRTVAPLHAVARGRALPAKRKILVLLEDWCGDAMNSVPVLAALVAQSPMLELRVLQRDRHLELMDRHLSDGARAIPVVIILDERLRELAWWGSRPAALKEWASSAEVRAMDPHDRYREIRRWYARDRGLTTLDEVLSLIERTTEAAPRAA